jgi:hypothetical protein
LTSRADVLGVDDATAAPDIIHKRVEHRQTYKKLGAVDAILAPKQYVPVRKVVALDRQTRKNPGAFDAIVAPDKISYTKPVAYIDRQTDISKPDADVSTVAPDSIHKRVALDRGTV